MAEPAETAAKVEAIRALIGMAQARADRAGLLADRYEALAAHAPGPHRELYRRAGRAHRGTQQRHAAVVELHARYLATWQSERAMAGLPGPASSRFVGTLADRLGAADIGLVLFADRQWVSVAGATPLVRAAQDLEHTLGEGPMREAGHGLVHTDTPDAIRRRWQRYGPEVTALGVRSVQTAAISTAGMVLGALLVLDRPPTVPANALRHLAEEVTLSLLLASASANPDDGFGVHPALDEANDWARIHQAAGIISVQQHCTVRDALDLLRAHAYADDIPTTRLAEYIVGRHTRPD